MARHKAPRAPVDIPKAPGYKTGRYQKYDLNMTQIGMLAQADMTAEQICVFLKHQGIGISLENFHLRIKQEYDLTFNEFKNAQQQDVGIKLYTKTINYLYKQLDAALVDPGIKINTTLLLMALKRFCKWDVSSVSVTEQNLTVQTCPTVVFEFDSAPVTEGLGDCITIDAAPSESTPEAPSGQD